MIHFAWPHFIKRYLVTGVLVLVPAWWTFLILYTLFSTLDHLWIDLLGPERFVEIPGVGIASFLLLILMTGMMATHFLGQWILVQSEESLGRIPLILSIYNTFKGMADIFKFLERFGNSFVVVFPFPRDRLWALGFVMGVAPPSLQVSSEGRLLMIFVPTAIHPFTGYLALVPEIKARKVNLRPQEAMKMEFSAGLYRPPSKWLVLKDSTKEER